MPALDEKSDLELLLDYSRGSSHAAFECLVQRHGSMVRGVARRALSNHHDAQDVTQATFLVLAREASKLTKGDSLAGWLHTVARRLSLNALKSRKARETREQAAMNEESSTVSAGPELQAELGRELDAALSRLPERYRQPLVLFHLEGASIEEASQRLNLHSGTLRTRLRRARALLRDALERRGVKVASVGMLAGMLATESQAASLSASGARGISEAVLGKGAMGSSAQALADGLATAPCLTGGALSTTLLTLMKTKASIIAASAVAIAALFTSANLILNEQAVEQPKHNDRSLAESRFSSPNPQRPQNRDRGISLKDVSTDRDLRHLTNSVFMIENEDQRLQAIRQRLGMNISDEVYRRALEECRYAMDPDKHLRVLLQKWTEADGDAAIQWAQRFPEAMGQSLTPGMLAAWLAQDEDAALEWAQANIDSKQLDLARQGAREWEVLSVPADQMAEYLARLQAYESLPQHERQPTRGMIDLDDAIELVGYKNPAATLEFMKSSGFISGQKHRWKIRKFFRGWAGHDPEAALAAASTQLEGKLRKDAMVETLRGWQAKYPDRSVGEVVDLEEFSADQYQELELSAVAFQARLNPESAFQRALQAESPELIEKSLKAAMRVSACVAEEETREWVFALPEGAQRDMSLSVLATVMAEYDYEKAVDLVGQISGMSRKEQAASEVLANTMLEDGDLDAGMRLADQLSRIPVGEMGNFIRVADSDQLAVFGDWLKKRHAEGKIRDEDGEYGRFMDRLEERKKELEE